MRTQAAVNSGRKQPHPTYKFSWVSVQTRLFFPYSCRTRCHGDTAQHSVLSFWARLISHGFISRKEWEHSIWILSLVNKFRFSFCTGHWSLLLLHTWEGTEIPLVHWVFSFRSGTDGWQAHEWLLHPEAPGSLLLGENSGVDLHRRETVTCISCLMILTLFENINVKHYHYG